MNPLCITAKQTTSKCSKGRSRHFVGSQSCGSAGWVGCAQLRSLRQPARGRAAPASSLGGPGEVCWEAASPLKGQAWESYDITPTASTSGTSPEASPGDRARARSMSGWQGWQHCFAKGVREYGEGSGGRQWHSVFPFVEFCFCISHDVPTFLCMALFVSSEVCDELFCLFYCSVSTLSSIIHSVLVCARGVPTGPPSPGCLDM